MQEKKNHLAYSHRIISYKYYNKFNDIEFIAKEGFSKIYKATLINRPKARLDRKLVALKELCDSKNISSKELNEVFLY
jgi:hypothetical protein